MYCLEQDIYCKTSTSIFSYFKMAPCYVWGASMYENVKWKNEMSLMMKNIFCLKQSLWSCYNQFWNLIVFENFHNLTMQKWLNILCVKLTLKWHKMAMQTMTPEQYQKWQPIKNYEMKGMLIYDVSILRHETIKSSIIQFKFHKYNVQNGPL